MIINLLACLTRLRTGRITGGNVPLEIWLLKIDLGAWELTGRDFTGWETRNWPAMRVRKVFFHLPLFLGRKSAIIATKKSKKPSRSNAREKLCFLVIRQKTGCGKFMSAMQGLRYGFLWPIIQLPCLAMANHSIWNLIQFPIILYPLKV